MGGPGARPRIWGGKGGTIVPPLKSDGKFTPFFYENNWTKK
jgi:hypothetical protein